MIAHLYTPDADAPQPVVPANGTDFTLEEAQKLVEGYVELVRLDDENILLVNEDGLLKRLPLNTAASKVADGYPLVGNVVLCNTSMFR